MKILLTLLLGFISLLTFSACNSFEETGLYHDKLISGTNNKIILSYPNRADKQLYLELFIISEDEPCYKNVVLPLEFNNNTSAIEYNFSRRDAMVKFCVTDGDSVILDFNKYNHIVSKEGKTNIYSYYYNLLNSDSTDVFKVFWEAKKDYPDDVGLYPILWNSMNANGIRNIDSLKFQIGRITSNYQNTNDKYLVLSIGYNILGNTDSTLFFLGKCVTGKISIINNDIISTITNGLLDAKEINLSKSMKDSLNNLLIENNPNSYYTLKQLTSLGKRPKNTDYYEMLKQAINSKNYFYSQLLFSMYSYLIFSDAKDSLNVINDYERLIEDIYNHPLEAYKNGHNANFTTLLNKNIFNEMKYWKSYKSEDYRNAAVICKANFYNILVENNDQLTFSNAKRISKLYVDKLNNVDSALKYLILCKHFVKETETEVLNELKNNFFDKWKNVGFEAWVDSLTNVHETEFKRNYVQIPSSTLIKFDNETIKIGSQKEKLFLVFYSKTCGVCKFIFKDLSKNKQQLSSFKDKLRVIYIADEPKSTIEIFREKYGLDFKHIVNGNELLDLFKVEGFPVVLIIDENGRVIMRQEGAGEDWKFENYFKYFL